MKSQILMEKAKQIIPGGVNSPVRKPPFIKKAKGSKLYDVDNNEYIDYVSSFGPMILGHNNETVLNSVKEALENGMSYGAPTEAEIELAELICKAIPSIEMIRMTSSGTEAVMSAIRVSRGFTGKDNILKFNGCYHGHSDSLLVKAGSGALTTSVPSSSGIPVDFAKHTITSEYNNCEMLKDIFLEFGNTLATVIVEPIAGNMGVIPPKLEFLKLLRELTYKYGVVLIFDEVITGFRLTYGGAQNLYDIIPDMTTLGKIIGGGMPVGAYGGRKEIMEMVSPIGTVYQAGTLSGNPIAMTAGITTLNILKSDEKIYSRLEQKGNLLEKAYISLSKKYNIPLTINRIGSLLTPFFTNHEVIDYTSATTSNLQIFNTYFEKMLANNIYIPPSQYEAMFLSDSITQQEIDKTIEAIENVFKSF